MASSRRTVSLGIVSADPGRLTGAGSHTGWHRVRWECIWLFPLQLHRCPHLQVVRYRLASQRRSPPGYRSPGSQPAALGLEYGAAGYAGAAPCCLAESACPSASRRRPRKGLASTSLSLNLLAAPTRLPPCAVDLRRMVLREFSMIFPRELPAMACTPTSAATRSRMTVREVQAPQIGYRLGSLGTKRRSRVGPAEQVPTATHFPSDAFARKGSALPSRRDPCLERRSLRG
jgi:hypothetical protein